MNRDVVGSTALKVTLSVTLGTALCFWYIVFQTLYLVWVKTKNGKFIVYVKDVYSVFIALAPVLFLYTFMFRFEIHERLEVEHWFLLMTLSGFSFAAVIDVNRMKAKNGLLVTIWKYSEWMLTRFPVVSESISFLEPFVYQSKEAFGKMPLSLRRNVDIAIRAIYCFPENIEFANVREKELVKTALLANPKVFSKFSARAKYCDDEYFLLELFSEMRPGGDRNYVSIGDNCLEILVFCSERLLSDHYFLLQSVKLMEKDGDYNRGRFLNSLPKEVKSDLFMEQLVSINPEYN